MLQFEEERIGRIGSKLTFQFRGRVRDWRSGWSLEASGSWFINKVIGRRRRRRGEGASRVKVEKLGSRPCLGVLTRISRPDTEPAMSLINRLLTSLIPSPSSFAVCPLDGNSITQRAPIIGQITWKGGGGRERGDEKLAKIQLSNPCARNWRDFKFSYIWITILNLSFSCLRKWYLNDI